MAGIFVFFTGPADGSVISRNPVITGGAQPFAGSFTGASMQFGGTGQHYTVGGFANARFPYGWGFSGEVPIHIRPGQTFQVTVGVGGMMETGVDGEGTPITEFVDGEATRTFVLENIVPRVTIDPVRSPEAELQSRLPYVVTVTGSITIDKPHLYRIVDSSYQVNGGQAITLQRDSNGRFNLPLSLPPGDHRITIHGKDQFNSLTSASVDIKVLEYRPLAAPEGHAKPTPSGLLSTASITSWTRLEPQASRTDIDLSSSARLFDPLWLMTRQWQVGEFQGEDTGTPVRARVRATTAPLTRCVFGEVAPGTITGQNYDPLRAPLEPLVERRPMRTSGQTDSRMLSLAVEAGQHFLRMLDLNTTARKYRAAFLATYALQKPQTPANAPHDDNMRRFVDTMVGRAPDARRLVAAFRHAGAPPIVFDAALKIAVADVPIVRQIATNWLAWYDGLFLEPATAADNAWTADRIEYAVSVATRLSTQSQDAITLSADEFDGGRLDWSSFDVDRSVTIDTTADSAFRPLNEATVPAPVTFPGTPAPRFWEMEDAKLAYGVTPVGPNDIIQLMAIEYVSSYGNDWFVIPLTVPVGNVTRVDSLVVTDSFGVRSLIRPIGDPALGQAHFSMWQQATRRRAGETFDAPAPNRFFLPPTIARSVDGAVLEDVLFMRDEMANMAWGIERTIESAIEQPTSCSLEAPNGNGSAPTGQHPPYRLASTVPDHWVPLLPVVHSVSGKLISRLKRGAVLELDGSSVVRSARSEVLTASSNLLLYDEEVPREGVHVTRRRRMARWIDGSTWVWSAFRADIGRGEGSSGLQFDQVVERGR